MKRNWNFGDSYPDDEINPLVVFVAAILLGIGFYFLESNASQPDIGAEPRSDVIWSERQR